MTSDGSLPGTVAPAVLASVVGRLRAAGCVYAEDEATLLLEAAGQDSEGQDSVGRDLAALERLVAARVEGEPLEQLIGWVAFAGLRIAVGPGVFVPRRRTELLAEQAVSLIDDRSVVVELCCGAGAVAAVLQRSHRHLTLYAVDVDQTAAAYARRNLCEPAVILVGDLYDPLPSGLHDGVDVIVANAPYVPTAAIPLMPREARDHEPAVALDGGVDGAGIHRRIIAGAPSWLRRGGRLLIETGREQSVITAAAMRDHGLDVDVVIDDDRDATVVVGRR